MSIIIVEYYIFVSKSMSRAGGRGWKICDITIGCIRLPVGTNEEGLINLCDGGYINNRRNLIQMQHRLNEAELKQKLSLCLWQM